MDSVKDDHESENENENENIILDFLNYNLDKNMQKKIDLLFPVYSADYMHEDVFDNIGIDEGDMHGEFNNSDANIIKSGISNASISNASISNASIGNAAKSLIQPFSEKEYFLSPHRSSTIAYKIWKDAGLFDYVTKESIDLYLYKYVMLNNKYYYDKGKMHITFYSESGTKYTYTWDSFVHWMMCCARKVEKK
jgi:hypothetical protein